MKKLLALLALTAGLAMAQLPPDPWVCPQGQKPECTTVITWITIHIPGCGPNPHCFILWPWITYKCECVGCESFFCRRWPATGDRPQKWAIREDDVEIPQPAVVG